MKRREKKLVMGLERRSEGNAAKVVAMKGG